ncbi:intradiol ring-cleavage dioxygenase [soil metagenome]
MHKVAAGNLSRREMLRLAGVAAAASLVGCVRGQSTSEGQSNASTPLQKAVTTSPRCVVRPEQTEGPYFVDEKLNRSDIRLDPSDGSVSQGLPLRLVLQVSRIDGGSCTPLIGAFVDIWQCDARGAYSDFQDFTGGFDTRGKKFLRGYQTTDANGQARFTTVYPGWYPGRAVHIHFKVRTDSASGRGSEFTSQLYFDDSITDQVHAMAPYSTKGRGRQKNDHDGIYRIGGKNLMLQLTKEAQGYAGTFDVGLQMT